MFTHNLSVVQWQRCLMENQRMVGVRPTISVNSLLGCPPLQDHLTHAACRPASVKERKKKNASCNDAKAVQHFLLNITADKIVLDLKKKVGMLLMFLQKKDDESFCFTIIYYQEMRIDILPPFQIVNCFWLFQIYLQCLLCIQTQCISRYIVCTFRK